MVLILVAVAMVAILVITAMAIDLGAKRADRRSDQTVADLASMAAGTFLAGYGSPTVVSNPFGACKAARSSAITNVPTFNPTQDPDSTCGVFPTNAKTGCSASTAPSNAVFSDATYTLTIRYPIPDSEITDSRFGGNGLSTNAGTDRCERMMVTFRSTADTQFAGIVGVDSQSIEASSIIRANTSQTAQGVAALLLLERVGCGALQTSGGGSGGEGVVVQAPLSPPGNPSNPGVIQVDSAGVVGSSAGNPVAVCGSGSSGNAGNYVVFGTGLPSGQPSVVAESSANGSAGIIGLYSLLAGGKPGYQYPGGLSVAPQAAQVSSRQPADDKYNKSLASGGSAQISTLHTNGYQRSNNGPLSGDALLSGNSECKGNITDPLKLNATTIYADCTTFEPALNIFPNARTFVVRGNVNIKSGSVLSLPVARTIYVRGCAVGSCSGGTGPNAIAVANGGALLVNTGEGALPPSGGAPSFSGGADCSTRKGPGDGGSTTNWATLATFSGPFVIGGLVRMCQTTAYLGKDTPTYTRQAVEVTGSTVPENYPAVAACSPTQPCPKVAGYDASIQVTGGQSATDWSAPNQLSVEPTAADFATNPFEDLALWTESDTQSALKGQGLNRTEGVYFIPNAYATFTGQGVQPIGLNAQYFVRALNVSSQGTLKLRPNPADAIKTPIPGALAIIR